jgi:pyruvate-ferredoxin/flavodoxin oxidoreductase
VKHFIQALPRTVKSIAVLDRTKEPGAAGEPLYQDVITALVEGLSAANARLPKVIGGRYGLSSKEFTPPMVKAVYDELLKDKPKNHFTVGIIDDVTHSSLDYDPAFSSAGSKVNSSMFYGLGADGTVGANKNSIKIIGMKRTFMLFCIRFEKNPGIDDHFICAGPDKIHSTYLVNDGFIGCHQFVFLEKYDVLASAIEVPFFF